MATSAVTQHGFAPTASQMASQISSQRVGSGVLGSIGAAVSRGSGSPVVTSTSAQGQYTLDGLLDRVSGLAASNTALSASQAEDLRKWQELQNSKVMEFNSAEAAKNRDWQKMMSDTAHQREVADLLAAGLNPVLSAMGGQGAYVGSGATASGVTSSGAKGDVDQSSSMGLVQLLGSLLASQTSLANAALSAQTNSAIAEKQNATSALIAQLTGQYGLARERLSGEYGLKRQYDSDVWANWRTSQTSAATKYAADQNAAASGYYADTQYAIHRDFPVTGIQALASVLGQFLGSGSAEQAATNLSEFFGDFTGMSNSEQAELKSAIENEIDSTPWWRKVGKPRSSYYEAARKSVSR